MGRPLRHESPDAIVHVTARGNGRATIHHDALDYESMLDVFDRAVRRYAVICWSFCLMGNHWHGVFETPRANLAAAVGYVNGVYARRHNRRHRRHGHLFGHRYHAVHIERDAHLLEVCRYVELNPVRAGLCSRPYDWRWSSCRGIAGLAAAPPFLEISRVLRLFAEDDDEARRRYRRFLAAGSEADPWVSLRGEIYLGSEAFADATAPGTPVADVARAQWQPVRPPLAKLIRRHGAEAVAVAHYRYGYRLRELAAAFGVHEATISRRLSAWERAHGRPSF